MPETILHTLKNAAYLRTCEGKRGRWPTSPKLINPDIMLQHLVEISVKGTEDDYHVYVDLVTNPILADLNGVKAVADILLQGE